MKIPILLFSFFLSAGVLSAQERSGVELFSLDRLDFRGDRQAHAQLAQEISPFKIDIFTGSAATLHPDFFTQGFIETLDRAVNHVEEILSEQNQWLAEISAPTWEQETGEQVSAQVGLWGGAEYELYYLDLGGMSANTIFIVLGAHDFNEIDEFPNDAQAVSSLGSYHIESNQSAEWVDHVLRRGQYAIVNGNTLYTSTGTPGVVDFDDTDFAPWGGLTSFNLNTTFFAPTDQELASGASIGSYEFDLFSIFVHEILHILGVRTADSYLRYIMDDAYHGPAMMHYDGEPVPLNGDGHLGAGVLSFVYSDLIEDGTETISSALMGPTIGPGETKPLTVLDVALLADIGWAVNLPPAQAGFIFPGGNPWSTWNREEFGDAPWYSDWVFWYYPWLEAVLSGNINHTLTLDSNLTTQPPTVTKP